MSADDQRNGKNENKKYQNHIENVSMHLIRQLSWVSSLYIVSGADWVKNMVEISSAE